jgi:hypothetical protein
LCPGWKIDLKSPRFGGEEVNQGIIQKFDGQGPFLSKLLRDPKCGIQRVGTHPEGATMFRDSMQPELGLGEDGQRPLGPAQKFHESGLRLF